MYFESILGILLGVVVLYIGYNYRINQSINPVSIPYAKVEITSRTKITAEMIGYTEVPKSLIANNENIITNADNLVGQYVNYGSVIPINSFFYSSIVVKLFVIIINPRKSLSACVVRLSTFL